MTNTTALQEFDFGAQAVRVHIDNHGNPWWVLTDICEALELTNPSKTAERLEDTEKTTLTFSDSGGRPYKQLLVNEPGLYRVIFRSNKPEAQVFQRWVFHEVLPAIRQTGTYTHPVAQPEPVNSNLGVLAGISQQLAGVVTDHEHRLATLEKRIEERPALPGEAMVTNLSTVRARFSGALREAVVTSGLTRGMDRTTSARFYQDLNSTLKNLVMCGRARENWKLEHYQRAVDYLSVRYDLDLRWIFKTTQEVSA